VKNLGLRFSASVPTLDAFPELSLLEGEGALGLLADFLTRNRRRAQRSVSWSEASVR